MNENNGVIILRSYYEAIKTLSKREQNVMYSAIFEYVFDEIEPELSSKLIPIWMLIRPNLDHSIKKYNANKANGSKGGRPRRDTENKNPTKNLGLTQLQNWDKPNLFIDKEKDKEKEKDIYISADADAEHSSDIYIPSPAATSLSQEEEQNLRELCGDKFDYLIHSVETWLHAGHTTKSLYNTCLTFIRNNPKEFKGKPIQDQQPDGWHYEYDVKFTTVDGYEQAETIMYKVYDDGRKERA